MKIRPYRRVKAADLLRLTLGISSAVADEALPAETKRLNDEQLRLLRNLVDLRPDAWLPVVACEMRSSEYGGPDVVEMTVYDQSTAQRMVVETDADYYFELPVHDVAEVYVA